MKYSVLFGVVLFLSSIGGVSAGNDELCMREWKSSRASKEHCLVRNILNANNLYSSFKSIDDVMDAQVCYVSVKCRSDEAEYHENKYVFDVDDVKNLRNLDGQLRGAAAVDKFSQEAQAKWKREKGVD